MASYFRQQLEDWLKTVDVKADKVLDVAGAQNPIGKNRVKSWDVKEFKILDLDQPHENSRKPDFVWDMNDWIENSGKEWEVVDNDVVFCIELMEYVHDPMTVCNNLNFMLKKGGILYISFPFIYPLHPPTGTDYLRYTQYGARKLLEEAGFEIIQHGARWANNIGVLMDFWYKDKYRFDKSEKIKDLTEVGCMIKAKKIC